MTIHGTQEQRAMKPATVWRSMLLTGGVLLGMPVLQAQSLGPVKVVTYDYDMAKVVLPPTLTETEIKGRHLFVLRCAACHTSSANSYGPRLDQGRVTALGDDGVRAKVAAGGQRMPGFRYMFSSTDVDHILAYLKSIAPVKSQGSAPAPAAARE